MAQRRAAKLSEMLPMIVANCNAMLDAGKGENAFKTFGRILQRYPDYVDLLWLMIEACRQAGLTDQADVLTQRAETIYQQHRVTSAPSQELARDEAWMDVLLLNKPDEALKALGPEAA
jgi:hypothetical protein